MIKIKNLSKVFWKDNEKVEILRNLNLEIKEGSFISIVWPSGSWKSTFLNMMSWIDTDFTWNLEFFSFDYKTKNENEITTFRWKNISYIFQNFKLIDNLTVRENIDLVIELNDLERNFSTLEILKLVGLETKADNYVFNLSWWESQRVAIARAFVWKTKLLLADEPTGSLDTKNKKIIMDLISSLHKKTKNTIVMITHDDEVAKISDIVYKMNDFNLIKS